MMNDPDLMREQNADQHDLFEAALLEEGSEFNAFPLSFGQQRLWFLSELEPDSPAYNMSAGIRLSGSLNMRALARALSEIIRRHEVLRTSFHSVGGQPVQVVSGPYPATFPIETLTHLPEAEREGEAMRILRAQAQEPFNLKTGPLMRMTMLRLGEQDHIAAFTMHHIISDGWSMGLFIREVALLYTAFSKGEQSPLPPLPIQYADYSYWQRTWFKGAELQAQLDYWKRQLANAPLALKLPSDRQRPSAQTFKGARENFLLSKGLSDSLRALSRREGVTLFMTLLAAFKVLLYRYTGQEDIVAGTPIAGRNQVQTESLIGFFVNTLAMRTDLSGDPSASELLRRVKEVALGAYANQELPFEKLVEELQPERDLSRQPLFQVSFALQNYPQEVLRLPDLTMRQVDFKPETSKFDLTLYISESGEELAGTFEYSADLFNADRIRRMAGHFETLLRSLISDTQKPVSKLNLLTERERLQLIREWNDTKKEYREYECAHHLFEAQAEQTPDAVAVTFASQQMSYRELNRRANQLAHYLRRQRVGEESIVALYLERGMEMMIALLGILKAGCAYLPLDRLYPKERLAYMINDSGAKAVLTERRLRADLPSDEAPVICFDSERDVISDEPDSELTVNQSRDNLAYVIYTSGSTGWPKGVMISHGGLINYLNWCLEAYPLGEGQGSVVHSPIGFDLTITALFAPLVAGRSVFLTPEDVGVESLASTVSESADFSLIKITPSQLELLSQQISPELAARWTRSIVIGGEALMGEMLDYWRANAPQTKLINEYGPTETVVGCCVFEVPESAFTTGPVPVGRPVINTQLYILDPHLQPVPIGVPGELYIGGAGIARGYLKRPDLTAEKFVPDPFSDEPGARLYKTGDLAQYLADGNIEYLGRIDHQVKLRGYRVELTEIDAVLSNHPGVREAVTIVREDSRADKRLVSFLALNPEYETEPGQLLQAEAEQVSQWQTLYEQTYDEPSDYKNTDFNIVGWNSSYTGEPIPAEEMQEWVDNTVERILSLKPRRVLEVGCGTGLLLFRIAPHCQEYCATDFSESALSHVRQLITMRGQSFEHVRLLRRTAEELEGFEEKAYDLVILNSVVQYFPSIDYLYRTLRSLVNLVADGGSVFLGDVRSLPLLQAFHASTQMYQAPDLLKKSHLLNRVEKQMRLERELIIDPGFFNDLRHRLPRVSQARTMLKRGLHNNELTRFRYDIILRIGAERPSPAQEAMLDWQKDMLTVESLRDLLRDAMPVALRLARVPNRRVLADKKTIDWLFSQGPPETAGEMKAALRRIEDEAGVDPEDLWRLSEDLPYSVEITWSDSSADGSYDVLLRRFNTELNDTKIMTRQYLQGEAAGVKPLSCYANNPLQALIAQKLIPELRSYLKMKLPDYMVPSSLVAIESLPLTLNGKVDRKALSSLDVEDVTKESSFVPPSTPIEEILAGIYEEVLGVERVGARDNFFELGGHSLLATRVISRVRQTLGVELGLRKLFERPEVEGLAQVVEEEMRGGRQVGVEQIKAVSRGGELELSYGQARLWFLEEMEGGSSKYNIAGGVRLRGELEEEAMWESLREVTRRHEVLRTSFPSSQGNPVQRITEEARIRQREEDLRGEEEQEREAKAQRVMREEAREPFDLEKGPLVRACLIKLGADDHVLTVVLHHIISDGWSMRILIREISQLYNSYKKGEQAELPGLEIQYADYAHWQRQYLQQDVITRQLAYWKRQLGDAPALIDLPTDRPRPAVASNRGGRCSFRIEKEETQRVREMSRGEGSTLFMSLLAVFDVLLYRYSGQQEILVGTPIAGRNRAEFEPMIGFFVNTLVMKAEMSGRMSYRQLLRQVRERALEAYQNQEVPFERVVEELKPERSLSHSPLFQVMIAWEEGAVERLKMDGLKAEPVEIDNGASKFDISLNLVESDGALLAKVEYSSDLFDFSTIERLSHHFTNLLASAASNPDLSISDLKMLDDDEQHQIIYGFNQTYSPYPVHLRLHHLFELQALRTPHSTALSFLDHKLTYFELDSRSNQLANFLISLGVRPESFVALCLDRSVDLVVAIFGVLKAGAAYIPLDTTYPPDRLSFMLEDAHACVVLTDQGQAARLPHHLARVICLDAHSDEIASQKTTNPKVDVSADNPAYVIYTSGSTGRPKGAVITHRAICNHMHWMAEEFEFSETSRVLQKTGISFDASVWEFYAPLMRGGELVMARPEGHRDSKYLVETIREEEISDIQVVPTMLRMMLEEKGLEKCEGLKRVYSGGEALSEELREKLMGRKEVELVNLYGPTEAAIDTTYWRSGWGGEVSIGRPIRNVRVYVLDENKRVVPIGVAGELYIGGEGLARCYIGRAGQTAESFLPDPYAKAGGERMYKTET